MRYSFLLLLAVSAPAFAEDKPTLIGRWEPVKTERLASGQSLIVEFGKEGKAVAKFRNPAGEVQPENWSWKIDGDKFTLVTIVEGKPKVEIGKVVKLTDKVFEVKFQSGAEETYKRLK